MKRIMVCTKPMMGLAVALVAIMTVCGHAGNVVAEMPTYTEVAPLSHAAKPRVTWHRTLRSGWQEARRRNVPMVIYISTDHCVYCDAMKRDTWSNETVEQRVSQDFVAILLTPQENEATLGRIDVAAYPTTLIGVPEGKIVGHRTGYQPAAALHKFLSEALKR
ncbi:thioredoxin family protein [Novipirellula rosea]|uniref:Uncharacterized protein n=1 Tax=Novipirellula rosea TaxID=1031540 RepID=A0ABP8MZC7_9BACT